MLGVIIEARNIKKIFAARFFKAFFNFFIDLFESFDAIGRKRGRDHRDVLFTLFLGKPGHLFYGVRLQPFFGAKF